MGFFFFFLVYKLYLTQSHYKTKRKIFLCKKEQNMVCWNELMVDQGWRGEEMGEGIVREFGMYVYTLLYFKG